MRPNTLTVSPTAPFAKPQFFMAKKDNGKINGFQLHNRILALMEHTSRYAFKGETRLAQDAGVSKSAVCRLLNGRSSPSFALVIAITRALEKRLGRPIDPRDLISLDGCYPTASACDLAGCKGCLPIWAYDDEGQIKPEYRDMKPGQWGVAPRSFPTANQEEGR